VRYTSAQGNALFIIPTKWEASIKWSLTTLYELKAKVAPLRVWRLFPVDQIGETLSGTLKT
jgi:hypothetical protein